MTIERSSLDRVFEPAELFTPAADVVFGNRGLLVFEGTEAEVLEWFSKAKDRTRITGKVLLADSTKVMEAMYYLNDTNRKIHRRSVDATRRIVHETIKQAVEEGTPEAIKKATEDILSFFGKNI